MNHPDVKKLINTFEEKKPELIFQWNDPYTTAKGWLVINSLRGGAAGGGTRMRKGLDQREVESLAKTMEIKFTVSGPQIGGAKSGLDFDPSSPEKKGVLQRWYKAIIPLLKTYYGTGGDLNVDELEEVIPFTEAYGLWHPQEGVVNGHYGENNSDKIKKIGQLRAGVSKIIEDVRYKPVSSKKYTIADMITGYGVAESVLHFYALNGLSVEGKRVIVQGWGNVGSGAVYYLAKAGAKIVGIIDREHGIMRPDGLSLNEVEELFNYKKGNQLNSAMSIPFSEVNAQIWDMQADVFLPCAASRIVSKEQIKRLMDHGLSLVSSGANVPFADTEIFYGPIAEYADLNISVIPDFIANCGMARVFAYLMSGNTIEISDYAIFSDVSKTIEDSLKEIFGINKNKTEITKTAFTIALNKIN